jgi:hypothetical protein
LLFVARRFEEMRTADYLPQARKAKKGMIPAHPRITVESPNQIHEHVRLGVTDNTP